MGQQLLDEAGQLGAVGGGVVGISLRKYLALMAEDGGADGSGSFEKEYHRMSIISTLGFWAAGKAKSLSLQATPVLKPDTEYSPREPS